MSKTRSQHEYFLRNRMNKKWKYNQAKNNAKIRNIPFLMSFGEWTDIWDASGHWDQRGWHKGQYVMARFGDRGAYEIGNVKICLAEENRAERNVHYPMKGEKNPAHGKDYWAAGNDEARERRAAGVSKRMKGVPKSAEQRAKMSAAARRNAATISAKMSVIARGRRRVIRDGRRAWAHPGDADYPREAA